MDTTKIRKLLSLREGEDVVINGVTYLRLGEEIKASPHVGDWDRDSWWEQRCDLKELLNAYG